MAAQDRVDHLTPSPTCVVVLLSDYITMQIQIYTVYIDAYIKVGCPVDYAHAKAEIPKGRSVAAKGCAAVVHANFNFISASFC